MELTMQRAERQADAATALQAIYVGGFLGLYDVMRAAPAVSAVELAERTGTHANYVRDWLTRQADLGLVEAVPGTPEQRYRLATDLADLLGTTVERPPFRRCLW